MNLVAGRVAAMAGDGGDRRGARHDDRRARGARGRSLRAGDAVRLVVRPEAIAIAAGDAGADGSLQATVTSRTFLGEKIEYLLRCADETLQVVRYDAGPGDGHAGRGECRGSLRARTP